MSKKNGLKSNNWYHIYLLAIVSIVLAVALINTASSVSTVPKNSVSIGHKTININLTEKATVKIANKPFAISASKSKEITDAINMTGAAIGPKVIHQADAVGPSGIKQASVKSFQISSIPGAFTFFRNIQLGSVIPTGDEDAVNEPTVMANGKRAFMTGNWYAASSNDTGATFGFIDPYADFPEFCCDQDTIYDSSRDMFIWYRAGMPSDGRFRLGTSSDTLSWNFYDLFPDSIDVPNSFWDFPQLALSNNYLYVAVNVFNNTLPYTWIETVMLKLNLDDLKSGAGLSGEVVTSTDNFNFMPVQGAKDVMYFASHNSNSNIRLFSWDEATDSINYVDRDIIAWDETSTGQSLCPGPDGSNWCGRTDSRMLAGWVANGTIGFMWNAKQGVSFPYPYIEGAEFDLCWKTYIMEQYICI